MVLKTGESSMSISQSGQHDAVAPARPVAFVQAGWHGDIVAQARESFIVEMARLGVEESKIDVIDVPGAFEIPLHARLLAESGRYAAIVAAGLVADGGIYRHEFVAHAVITGLMQVQLETRVPVLSCVLTPQGRFEGDDRHRFFYEHFRIKGAEAARACAATMASLSRLQLQPIRG
jgi:6,7-dimethyl-8-ribityllumazine synthase